MAKDTTMGQLKPGPFQRLQLFLQEVKTEMDKVTWPTKDELRAQTQVTIILLGIMAAIIFVYDQVFQAVMLALLGLAT
jgi:preprotein translocase subunit SecE